MDKKFHRVPITLSELSKEDFVIAYWDQEDFENGEPWLGGIVELVAPLPTKGSWEVIHGLNKYGGSEPTNFSGCSHLFKILGGTHNSIGESGPWSTKR